MIFIPPINVITGAGAAYAGPGNVVSGAFGWWGLRAYSLASIGANAVRLRESGGNTEQDFATIAGGGLDLAAIATFKGANNLFVAKLYDQVGTNHLVQATTANQPAFTLSGLGSLPIMTSTGTPIHLATSAVVADSAQPDTFSFVGKRSSGAAYASAISSSQLAFFGDTSGLVGMYAGTIVTVSGATEGSWHAVQAVINGSSGILSVDGTATTGLNAGASSFSGGPDLMYMFNDKYSNYLTGSVVEAGAWFSGFTTTQAANMSTNQHAYWGF